MNSWRISIGQLLRISNVIGWASCQSRFHKHTLSPRNASSSLDEPPGPLQDFHENVDRRLRSTTNDSEIRTEGTRNDGLSVVTGTSTTFPESDTRFWSWRTLGAWNSNDCGVTCLIERRRGGAKVDLPPQHTALHQAEAFRSMESNGTFAGSSRPEMSPGKRRQPANLSVF